ncbi:ABC transporter permease subunit, partial [Candidatus Poribacteria bacterium]|nr:ABC transporter permease subunit [Candidatus Poribacteria bacterium]
MVSTVFSLLALLFTFDVVAGEREVGTIRITLSNAVPRDIFLWGKLIGGYLVFVVPFLVSFLFGLLLLVWQGFPLGESDIFPRVLGLTAISLLYIGVFFAIGTMISTYLDSAKTALIIAFTVWVFAVLITPRLGFLAAKVIAPVRTAQSVYMEKKALRDDSKAELEKEKMKMIMEIPPDDQGRVMVDGNKINELMKPLAEEHRLKIQDHANRLDRAYKRETKRQEQVGETFSRITPTSSLIYLATNLTQTGKVQRSNYLQTGDRYYDMLHTDLFSKIDDYAAHRMYTSTDIVQITQPPPLKTDTLVETLRQSVVDVLL